MAEAKPRLHLVNTQTGEVLEGPCEDCQNYERQNRSLMRQRKTLENQLAEKRKTEAQAKDIIEVLSYWRDRCAKRPDSTRVERTSHPRWEKVRDRLKEDFTVAELKLAIEGALANPWHNGTHPKNDVTKGGKQYLNAETIFLDAKRVEAHKALAEKFVQVHVDVVPSQVFKALRGMNMATELEVCGCGHYRMFHVGVAETNGREVCRKCDCGGFAVDWGVG